MKILWAKSDFLHPTERGGQIRTLETLRRLHAEHEIHYVAYRNPDHPESVQRASEYASEVYPVELSVPPRRSIRFLSQATRNLFERLPLSIARYRSPQMRSRLAELQRKNNYDAVVCDFLAMAPNFADLGQCVLFQHNVEYTIWERHAAHAGNALARWYFQQQRQRTYRYERESCRTAARVIAVSEVDRDLMRNEFGVNDIMVTPTGVDVDTFAAPPGIASQNDLVFVGAMDWMPNIDGMLYFVREILPLIRKRVPGCSLVIAGRTPVPAIRALAQADPLIQVTGTVPDVRPYLWSSKVSIVPLRIGGGTRLKIYEAMAAGRPVVATAVGAEGLEVHSGRDIVLADQPEAFADACVRLLAEQDTWNEMSIAARRQAERFSWTAIARHFAGLLEETRLVKR